MKEGVGRFRRENFIKLFNKVRSHSDKILIFSLFTLLSLLITYPLIVRIGTSLYYGQVKAGHFSNDIKGVAYALWWIKYAWQNGLSGKLCSLLASPYGVSQLQSPIQPVLQYPTFILTLLSNEIFAYNLLIFLSFPFSAITMYFLVHHLTKNKLSGMLSGVIYAFSSYHILQSYYHLGLALIQWLPLYVLFLFKFKEERTYYRGLWCAISFVLVTLTAYYYGYFMLVFSLIFMLFVITYEYFAHDGTSLDYKTLKLVAFIILLCFLLITPFTLNILMFGNPRFAPQAPAMIRFTLEHFAAQWWSYLVPSFENPIFGKYTSDYLYSRMSGNPAEQILYLGFIPLALALLALVIWAKRKIGEPREHFAVPFFWVMIIVAIVWSVPPYISLGELEIPMPSSFMYNIAPMFRQYGRFGLLAIFSVAILAGIGSKHLSRNILSLTRRYLIAFAVSLLLLLEFINVPPFKTLDVSAATTPAVYKWLALQKGNFVIAEYPFLSGSDPRQYDYLFYQRIHKKKMINGAPEYEPAARTFSYLGDIARPETLHILRYLGVKYAIIHTSLYRENGEETPKLTSARGLSLVRTFPDGLVYRVTAKPEKILWVRYKNFYPTEVWEDGKEWSWITNTAELLAVNYTGRNLPSDVYFSAISLGKPRLLKIKLNGKLVKKLIIPPSATEVVLRDIRLRPGENSIIFSTDSSPEQIDTYYHNGDAREATLAFSDFRN